MLRSYYIVEKFKLQGHGHNVKNVNTYGKVLSFKIFIWYSKALALTVEKLLVRLKISKKWAKLQGKKWYPQKGLITGNIHMKYQSSSTHCLKVINMVKFSKKWVKLQSHRVKNNGTHRKVLSQGIIVWNIKALALTVLKLLARLQFSKNGPNSKVKVTG